MIANVAGNVVSRDVQHGKDSSAYREQGISRAIRPRRLRTSAALRSMLSETRLSAQDLILPLFVIHGDKVRIPIESMPGIFQLSVDEAVAEAQAALEDGIRAVLLFGIPDHKDAAGSQSFAADGIVQQAIRALREHTPDLVIISDVCLCEYTDHGHCGLLNFESHGPYNPHLPDGYVLNDETLDILGRIAVSHAQAGADIIAPSGMLDHMVAAIRSALDGAAYDHVPILSYAVKYASAYYGPFRDAAQGAPAFGDRTTHQMNPANVREALREAALDIAEGADMLMVKPALAYLDVIRTVHDQFSELPLIAYNVSGEYAMVKAASMNGWLNERAIVLETLTGIKRAGADLIITYHARDAARWLVTDAP